MKILLLVAAVFLTCSFSFAEKEAPLGTVGLADELVTVLRVEEQMTEILGGMPAIQNQALAALPEGLRETVSKQVNEMVKKNLLDWKTLRPRFVEIYATTFTAEELRAMISFFRSPVGQKWIEKQPEIQLKTATQIQEVFRTQQPTMIEGLMKMFQTPSGE